LILNYRPVLNYVLIIDQILSPNYFGLAKVLNKIRILKTLICPVVVSIALIVRFWEKIKKDRQRWREICSVVVSFLSLNVLDRTPKNTYWCNAVVNYYLLVSIIIKVAKFTYYSSGLSTFISLSVTKKVVKYFSLVYNLNIKEF